MKAAEGLSQNLQNAVNNGVLKRLPLTFLPFVNEQLQKWQYLFPNERSSVQRLLLYVDSLSAEQSSALFKSVVQLEEKMGIRRWQFSTTEQSIQNSSQLARSPYFLEWRRAVQVVFDTVDQQALQTSSSAKRIVLLDIPRQLPVNPATIWRRWRGIGEPVNLEMGNSENSLDPFEVLLACTPPENINPSPAANPNRDEVSANAWVIDAGSSAVDAVLKRTPESQGSPRSILLSYERLASYRQNFSREMNTMHKDLADADAVFDHLRTVDVNAWCPPEVSADPAVREFVRSLYLTGNGAVIFGNSFVEWGASEAFRRARPSFLAAKFGVRAKPKPFTGVAVFDNPDQVNPAPSVDDLPGSAADAEMLALYIWLSAQRYNEYQHSTVCICLAESISQVYIVAPPEFTVTHNSDTVSLQHLGTAISTWLS